MAEPQKKVSSADIRAALLLRYPKASHALVFEVAPETGGGTRYADAVAVGLWKSHGHKIEGFEIKVSRSDFLNELKQPEKSQPVFRYCNLWWLVTPKGLVQPDELPENWGLLELQDSGSLRERVKPGKLKPDPITVGFFASLMRRGTEADHALVDSLVRKQIDERVEQAKSTMRYERSSADSLRVQAAESGMALLERIKEETGLDLAGSEWRQPKYLEAIKILAALAGDYGPLVDAHKSMMRLVRELQPIVALAGEKQAQREVSNG